MAWISIGLISPRVCILREQKRLAGSPEVHHLLGGDADLFWCVYKWISVLWLTCVIALHYPYVLAFEPSFVEVRHVETGNLMQVIQGSNLRCLFAENPPSTTNTASPQYSQQHYPSRTPYGMSAPNAYGGRQSMYSQYSMSTTFGFTHGQDRDEIIMVSEDRIMALRLATASAPPVGLQPSWNGSTTTLYSQQSAPQQSMPYQQSQAAYSQTSYSH